MTRAGAARFGTPVSSVWFPISEFSLTWTGLETDARNAERSEISSQYPGGTGVIRRASINSHVITFGSGRAADASSMAAMRLVLRIWGLRIEIVERNPAGPAWTRFASSRQSNGPKSSDGRV